MELRQYLERRLFAPADLSSLTADDGRHLIPRAARGLHHAGKWTYAEPMDMSVAWGAYDLVATAPDICRWLNALQTGRVVPKQLLGLMFDTVTGAHSCGFSMGAWRLVGTEHRLAQHFGDVNGFFAFMSVLPGGGAVAVLSNAFGMPVERLAHDIARVAAGDELPPLSPASAPSQEEPEPPPYIGRYRADDGTELVIGWQGGHVMLESRRRYGVPMRYPAWQQSGQSNRLLTRVLPESVDITVCDGCRATWVDAEGLTRNLEVVVE